MPRIDRLYGRLIVTRQCCEVHHLSIVDQLPSVEIAPVVGGKLTEQRVLRINGQARGMRRPHLKPTRIPEDGQVGLLHIVAIAYLAGRRDETTVLKICDTPLPYSIPFWLHSAI